jgi:hypothetical protein
LASGVLGGTTNSPGVAQFPSNGATAGHDGLIENTSASTILYCTSPNTVIATSPTNPTTAAAGDFTFTSLQSGVTFECSLDSVLPFTNCAGTAGAYTTPALNNGPHTIDVRAVDINGNVDATPAHYAWTVNAAATLDTTIASAPATLTNVAAATFTFTSVPATGVTFQCSLDGSDTGPWTTCSSPYTTAALTNGTHVIYVRARDAGGNVDPTPASYTWTVDLIPPDTTIVTNPDNPTNSPTGDFTFSGIDAGGGAVTFECRIDSGVFAACPAAYTTPALTYGSHTLYVRAVDLAGNVDATPAAYTWEVHLLGLDGSVVDTAVPDSAVIDGAVILADSAVPDTRLDSAVPDLPIVVSPDVRLDSPVADRASVPDAPAVGIPDAEADGGLGDALADVGGRDAVAKDTQVFPVVDSSPIDTTAPNLVPDAEIVVDTAVPVPPVPDAAVGPGPPEPTLVLNNPKVMGSGFCSVNPMPGSAPGLFTFFLVAAFGLLISRRRR